MHFCFHACHLCGGLPVTKVGPDTVVGEFVDTVGEPVFKLVVGGKVGYRLLLQ